MTDLYNLFVISGYTVTPDKILEKSPEMQDLIRVFIKKAVHDINEGKR